MTCLLRPSTPAPAALEGLTIRRGDITDHAALARAAFDGEPYDAVLSCLASRDGAPEDAWAVDHDGNVNALRCAAEAGAGRFVLVSAICVQKPRLAFQYAKRAFEQALTTSGVPFVIVRPTAFFKSLSGQVARVKAGRAFLMFGDGSATACKPISDGDLARFLVRAIEDDDVLGRTLPIGGPGPALTPRAQGEMLFELLGRAPRFRRMPSGLFRAAGGALGAFGRISKSTARAAEFARIAHYYATESMLVWDEARGAYSASATPETGSETLRDHYAALLSGRRTADLGAHALFSAADRDA